MGRGCGLFWSFLFFRVIGGNRVEGEMKGFVRDSGYNTLRTIIACRSRR